jgi:hypothetical protein
MESKLKFLYNLEILNQTSEVKSFKPFKNKNRQNHNTNVQKPQGNNDGKKNKNKKH